MPRVVTLLAHGCPLHALVVALGCDERTVASWWARAGQPGRAGPAYLVEQPRDLGHVQADASRVKTPGGVVWLALAMMVRTRLWRAGEVRAPRDLPLIRCLLARVRAGALNRPLWCWTDGLAADIRAMRATCRDVVRTGKRGRPRCCPWQRIRMAPVVKRAAKRRVVEVERRIGHGSAAQVEPSRCRSPGDGVSNTASREPLNAPCRARLSALTRRGRALARQAHTRRHGMYRSGTVSHGCPPHERLRVARAAASGGRLERPPAMAAGLTEQCWSVQELRSFQVSPHRWRPPKRRGRPSRAMQRLVARWCS